MVIGTAQPEQVFTPVVRAQDSSHRLTGNLPVDAVELSLTLTVGFARFVMLENKFVSHRVAH